MNRSKFTCVCGMTKGWITDGKQMIYPCPICGRIYKGQHDQKNLTINAVEIGMVKPINTIIRETQQKLVDHYSEWRHILNGPKP